MAAPLSLKDYLKRYESGAEDGKKKKKKKKKTEKPKPSSAGGIRVVDEDPVWQKPVQIDKEESESSGEEKPQVDEDIEVKRMKRLEAIRARKPYHAISEDGSGWVSISDTSRPTLKSGESSCDMSPPRRGRTRFDTPSPEPGESRSGSQNSDLSPPRQRRRRRADTPSPEPGDGAPGVSPPRRRAAEDISPPRRTRRPSTPDPDLSPPRRRGGKDSSDDLSPPRRIHRESPVRRQSSPDLSPPRKRIREAPVSRSGLVSIEEFAKENERKRKEAMSRFASMDPYQSGKGAEPVFRDKQGKRISKEELLKTQEEEKPKDKKLEWGKGLVQKREAEARAKELELEQDKPFARTRDDPELDKILRERSRWGDPMAHLVKKKSSDLILEDLGDNENMKESGFIIPQGIPSHSWLKRGVDFPPNRYGIKPGRHWDGVDRSNGFEKEQFKRQNEKRATEREAYLWSVSDM